MASPSLDASAVLARVNHVLHLASVPDQIHSLADADSTLFLLLFRKLFLWRLPNAHAQPSNPDEHAHNYALLLKAISSDVLQMDLSHISPQQLAAGALWPMHNLASIFVELCEILIRREAEPDGLEGGAPMAAAPEAPALEAAAPKAAAPKAAAPKAAAPPPAAARAATTPLQPPAAALAPAVRPSSRPKLQRAPAAAVASRPGTAPPPSRHAAPLRSASPTTRKPARLRAEPPATTRRPVRYLPPSTGATRHALASALTAAAPPNPTPRRRRAAAAPPPPARAADNAPRPSAPVPQLSAAAVAAARQELASVRRAEVLEIARGRAADRNATTAARVAAARSAKLAREAASHRVARNIREATRAELAYRALYQRAAALERERTQLAEALSAEVRLAEAATVCHRLDKIAESHSAKMEALRGALHGEGVMSADGGSLNASLEASARAEQQAMLADALKRIDTLGLSSQTRGVKGAPPGRQLELA